jgi:hypothetical protein
VASDQLGAHVGMGLGRSEQAAGAFVHAVQGERDFIAEASAGDLAGALDPSLAVALADDGQQQGGLGAGDAAVTVGVAQFGRGLPRFSLQTHQSPGLG